MAVLIEKNGSSKNFNIIMDQMYVLKVKMDALNELIETETSASKMWENKISLVEVTASTCSLIKDILSSHIFDALVSVSINSFNTFILTFNTDI